jgi:hypothetical protein
MAKNRSARVCHVPHESSWSQLWIDREHGWKVEYICDVCGQGACQTHTIQILFPDQLERDVCGSCGWFILQLGVERAWHTFLAIGGSKHWWKRATLELSPLVSGIDTSGNPCFTVKPRNPSSH